MFLKQDSIVAIKDFLDRNRAIILIVLASLLSADMVFHVFADSFNARKSETTPIAVEPVNYAVDQSRLTCYGRRIPQEVQHVCDSAFPSDSTE